MKITSTKRNTRKTPLDPHDHFYHTLKSDTYTGLKSVRPEKLITFNCSTWTGHRNNEDLTWHHWYTKKSSLSDVPPPHTNLSTNDDTTMSLVISGPSSFFVIIVLMKEYVVSSAFGDFLCQLPISVVKCLLSTTRSVTTYVMNLYICESRFVYYEWIKRDLKTRPIGSLLIDKSRSK